MDAIFKMLQKPARLLATVCLLVATGVAVLTVVPAFPDGFFPVIGHLVLSLFHLALIAGIPVLFLLKKDGLAKALFLPYFSYWLISTVYNFIGDADWIGSAWIRGIDTAVLVFELIIGLALLAVAILFALSVALGQPKFRSIAKLLFLGVFGLWFVMIILQIVQYGTASAEWTSYFDAFGQAALAAGLFFTMLAFEKPATVEATGHDDGEEI